MVIMKVHHYLIASVTGIAVTALFAWIVSTFGNLSFLPCFLIALGGLWINGIIITIEDRVHRRAEREHRRP